MFGRCRCTICCSNNILPSVRGYCNDDDDGGGGGDTVNRRRIVSETTYSRRGFKNFGTISVLFVLTYFLVLVLVAVFEIFFSFSFVLVFIIFSF